MSDVSYGWVVKLLFNLQPEVRDIMSIIENHSYNIRMVGGCVRNILLEEKVKDIDLVTDCKPAEVIKILESYKYKILPIGLSHGTVAVNINGELIEITTARSDISCDGRYAKVEFSKDFKVDAGRRDFTVNALSIDMKGNLYDYYSGISDIKAKKLTFIGDANIRVQEDFLRILRLFRFYGEYFDIIEDVSLEAAKNNANRLSNLSSERIYDELQKIFLSKKSFLAIEKMFENSIFPVVFSEQKADFEFLSQLISLELKFNIAKSFLRYLIALLNEKQLSYVSTFWIKKKSDLSYIKTMQAINFKEIISENKKKYYLYQYGYKLTADILILNAAKNNITESRYINIDEIQVPIFPITGHDIMLLGYVGRDVGKYYKILEKTWIESGFKLTKQELVRYLNNEKN